MYDPPKGRIKPRRRRFQEIAKDYRRAVFAVVRLRTEANGIHTATPLGSGFFITPSTFLTCHHVVNPPNNPHIDGDTYHLVGNFDGSGGKIHSVVGQAGSTLLLHPANDAALVISPQDPAQPFVSLTYACPEEGTEIGVAGYPLAQVSQVNGELTYAGLIYRVGRGTITAAYETHIPAIGTTAPILEVNFLFVSGNSGGPIFEADTGLAVGFVHGFSAVTISESQRKVQIAADKALHGQDYIHHVTAIYSLGLRFTPLKAKLEQLGVSPR